MAITIDSMLWIYAYDPHAPERDNVKEWMFRNGVVQGTEPIILNTIIPLEVLHSLGRNPAIDFSFAYNASMAIVALKNVVLIDFDSNLLTESIMVFGKYRSYGIGGRDASILATMLQQNVNTIATHDKNLLSIVDFVRIDPVFSPPRILPIGEPFIE
ncbi:MAG: type II toxin-antitoxin system VapC family toxin [Candidatus Hodarchaeales archaeon]|jgi:predicted nucleic acid-binding protein